MKSLKLFLVLAVAATLTVACKNDKAGTADAALATPQTTAPATTQSPAAAPAETVPVGPLTSITFDETEHNFGDITEGDKVTHIYTFKNTGSEPLVISKAQGSCGCTVPDWPREPIPVGGSGEIKVQYDSRGKGKTEAEGGRSESKRVTITANTDPANTYLYIKGKVFKPETAPAS